MTYPARFQSEMCRNRGAISKSMSSLEVILIYV